jgi:hypothetical protein
MHTVSVTQPARFSGFQTADSDLSELWTWQLLILEMTTDPTVRDSFPNYRYHAIPGSGGVNPIGWEFDILREEVKMAGSNEVTI